MERSLRRLSSRGVAKLDVGVEENACFLCVVAMRAPNHRCASLPFHLKRDPSSEVQYDCESHSLMACARRYLCRPSRGVSATDAPSAMPGLTLLKLIVLGSSPH